MHFKIIFILFLLKISEQDDLPKIKILDIENPTCSKLLGRIDFKAKYSYDSLKTVDSYFLLFFKDKTNQKRSSICKIPSPKGDNGSDKNQNNSSNEPITSSSPTPSSSSPTPSSSSPPPSSSSPPPSSSKQPDETDIEQPVPILDDNLKELLKELRLSYEDNFQYDISLLDLTLNKLIDMNPNMTFLLKFDFRKKLKNLINEIDEIEIKLLNATEIFVIPSIQELLLKIKKIADFNMTELKINISDTICSFNQEFIKSFSYEKTHIAKLKDKFKNKNLTKIVEEDLKSINQTYSLVNFYTKLALSNTPINNLVEKIGKKISEAQDLPEKIVSIENFFNGIKQKINDSKNLSIINDKLDGIKEKLVDGVISNMNASMTNFNYKLIDELIDIQNKLKDLKENKAGNKNGIKEIIKEKLEELKQKIQDYLNKNPYLKPIKEKFEKLEDKFNAAKQEIIDLKEILKDGNEQINQGLKQRFYDLLNSFQSFSIDTIHIDNKEIINQIKNLTLIQSIVNKLKEIFDSQNLNETISDKENKMKSYFEKIKKEIDEFLDDNSTLKLTKSKLNEVKDKLKEIVEIDAFKDVIGNKTNFENVLKNTGLKQIDQISKLLDLEDNKLKNVKREEILNAIQDLKQYFTNASKIAEAIKQPLSTFQKNVNDNLKSMINSLKDKLQKISFNDTLDKIKNNLEDAGLPEAFSKHFDTIKNLGEPFEKLKSKNKELFNKIIFEIQEKIKQINGSEILDKMKGTISTIQQKEESLLEYFENSALVKAYKDFLLKKGDTFTSLKNMTLLNIKNLIFSLAKKIDATNLVEKIFENEELIKNLLNSKNLEDDLKRNEEELQNFTNIIIAECNNLPEVESFCDSIISNLQAIKLSGIKDTLFQFKKSLNNLEEEIKKLFSADLANIIEDKIRAINGEDILNKISLLNNFDLKSALSKANNSYFNTILEKINDIKEIFNDTNADIASVVKAYINSFDEIDNAIKKIITAEEQGIKDQFKTIIDTIKNIRASADIKTFLSKMQNMTNNIISPFDNLQNLIDLNKTYDIKDEIKKLKDSNLNNDELKKATVNYIISIYNLLKSLKNFVGFKNGNNTNTMNYLKSLLESNLNKINITEYILILNNTMFDKKDDIINSLNDTLNNMMDKVNLTLITILEKLLNENNKFEDSINDKIENIKGKLKNINNIIVNNLEEFNNSMYNCDFTFFKKKVGLDMIQKIFAQLNPNSTEINDPKKILEMIDAMLKNSTLNNLLGTSRYQIIKEKVEELNNTINDALTKMELDKYIEKNRKIKNKLKEAKNKFDLIEIIYKAKELKNKIKDLNVSDIIDKMNSTLEEAKEEVGKLMEIGSNAEKVRHILNKVNLTGLGYEKIENVQKSIEESKKKADSLKDKLIINLVEKANEKLSKKIKLDLDSVHEKVEEFLTKWKDFEKNITEFPKEEEETKYNEILDKIKEDLKLDNLRNIKENMNNFVSTEIEKYNNTFIAFAQVMNYLNNKKKELPENIYEEEYKKYALTLFNETLSELKDSLIEIAKNSTIVDRIKNKFNNTKLNEFLQKFKNISEPIEKNLKDYLSIKKNIFDFSKEMEDGKVDDLYKDLNKQIKEQFPIIGKSFDLNRFEDNLKKSSLKGLISNAISKLKNIKQNKSNESNESNESLLSLLKFIDFDKLKNITSLKDRINDITSKLKNLRQSKLDESNESLLSLLKSIDFNKLLTDLNNLNEKRKNVKEEIEKVKTIVSLIKEISELLENPDVIKIIDVITKLNGIKVRLLSEKKEIKKVGKKQEKLRRVETIDYLDCKIDDSFSSADNLILTSNNIKSNELLKNNIYDIEISKDLTLNLEDSETKCSNSSLSNLKSNIKYINHSNFEIDKTKNRIQYDLFADINDQYEIPEFFYLIVNRTIKYQNNTEDEIETYCVLEDQTNRKNAKFNCFGYLEDNDINEVGSLNDKLSSYYIEIPEQNPELNRGINFFKKTNSKGLSAGAIVGIIFGCVAVVIALIVIISFAKKSAVPVITASIAESQNNLKI